LNRWTGQQEGRPNHRRNCGLEYVVVPKEIPLAKDEQFICDNCGRELKGRWSSRNLDYEPFHLFPVEAPRKH
jgi:hypothetical protein